MTRSNQELDAFLNATVRYANTTASADLTRPDPPEQPTTQELTSEEETEYMRFAMQNLGITTSDSGVVAEVQEAEEIQPEPEPEPEPEPQQPPVPPEEQPIQLPDYTEVREELLRFSDAEWFKKIQEKIIILAGVGGIGSNMAVILAKLNPAAIYIFDSDTVEAVNLAGQFYSNDDIGRAKVDALAASVIKYTNYSSIFAMNRRYMTGESIVSDIMVCGFDSMRSRRDYFHVWKNRVNTLSAEEKKKCLFIDGRLTADEFQIFCMTGEDDYYMEAYERDYLFQDYQVQSLPCSFKQTGFLADMIGAFMVNLIVNFCANEANPGRNMTLPFKTSYRTDIMFLDQVK